MTLRNAVSAVRRHVWLQGPFGSGPISSADHAFVRGGVAAETDVRSQARTVSGPGADRRLRIAALAVAAAATLGTLGLTGCGVSEETLAAAESAAVPGHTIVGHVHGGVFPIRGATIKLMQTVTSASTTYGSAATTLLQTTSDQYGYFTFPDTGWTCAANEFAYIVVTSGHTSNLSTTVANNNVVQVGVIGPCSELATQAQIDNINVFVSELSTVAAAAALGNFMTVIDPADGTGNQVVNIGAPKNNSITSSCTGTGASFSCKAAGLSHAFTNAITLVDSVRINGAFPTGQANFANSANNVSSVPAPLINTMGNILQQCVDSTGNATTPSTPSAACQTLFANAKVPGATAGPSNTLQVAMNMVKYPTNNIAQLFGSVAPTVPFTPSLISAPTSFAVSIFYGVTFTGSTVQYPVDLALDSADNAYVLYANGQPGTTGDTYSAVNEWNASGKLALAGAANTKYLYPSQVAVDNSDTVYVTNNDPTTTNDVVLRLSGSKLYPVASLVGASGLAIDNNSNIFASSTSTGSASVTEYSTAAMAAALTTSVAGGGTTFTSAAVTSSSAALGPTSSLAVDSAMNLWGAGLSGSTAAAFLWQKTSSTTAPYTAGAGISASFTQTAPFSVAIDSTNQAYFPLKAELTSATYSGSALTVNSAVATATGSNAPHRSEVDGAGNVFWTDLESTGVLYQYSPTATTQVVGILPCFAFPSGSSYNCITTSTQTTQNAVYTPANFRSLAIDSAGNIWYAADAGYGAVIETLGLAAPTWPLLSYGHPGVQPN